MELWLHPSIVALLFVGTVVGVAVYSQRARLRKIKLFGIELELSDDKEPDEQ